ncbi:MAG: FAD-dependent oxidoreductase [Desulfobacterales bacterium]|nr:MAG: FAD-dependent oxidoreductase [Desulfobacterales bacterium]
MSNQFQFLFQPGQIGNMTLKNRVVMPPMERCYANEDGSVTQRYIDYLVERAKGGVSLIFVESTYVDPVGRGRRYQLGVYDDSLIPGLRRMAEAVQQQGAKIAIEIHHAGRETSATVTGRQLVAPSPVPCLPAGGEIPRELTLEEIHQIIDLYGEAARRVKEAGFNMVEIHGAHGYLVNQFLSSWSNQRKDEYGGPLENRMRFPLEVLAKVRANVGPEFPIDYRLSADEFLDGGLTLDETLIFAGELEKYGIDAIHVSAGIYESAEMITQPMDIPPACLEHLASEIKRVVSVPIIAVGRINDPILAEKVLERGSADFVSMGRALHIDPECLVKAQQGKMEDIRRCFACNQGCLDLMLMHRPSSCTLNPEAGREREMRIRPSPQRKKVFVIGGGPAGLEAARVCALRGHHVSLYEKSGQLGGQILIASKAPRRSEFEEIPRYLTHAINKLGIDVHLNREVSPAMVLDQMPDAVIVATGARPVIPRLPGNDSPGVCTAWEVLLGEKRIRTKAIVFGGGQTACEVADFLASQGVPVILAAPDKTIAPDLQGTARGSILFRELEAQNVDIRLETTIERIAEEAVTLQHNGRMETIGGVQNVVIALGRQPENALYESLLQQSDRMEVYGVGDCIEPRKSIDAIAEASKLARWI